MRLKNSVLILFMLKCIHATDGLVPCDLPTQQELTGAFSEDTTEGTVLFAFPINLSGASDLTIRPQDTRDQGYLLLNHSGLVSDSATEIYLNSSLDLNLLNPKPIQPPVTSEELSCNLTEPEDYNLSWKSRIIYIITCTSGGNEIIADVSVIIETVNNYPPMFHCPPYHKSISELTSVSSTVFTLQNLAYDPDVSGNPSVVQYSIKTSGPFSMSGGATVGVILLDEKLDYDLGQTTYVINVTAADSGLSSEAQLYIHLSDYDDLTPVFTQDVYEVIISEEDPSTVNQSFTMTPRILAYDQDAGINATLEYRLYSGHFIDDTIYFSINASTGHIVPLHLLDRENVDMFRLTIKAHQIDNPSGRTARAEVIVTVGDINDHQPVMLNDVYDVTVQEELLAGSFVCQVSAHDADTGNNSALELIIDDPYESLRIDSYSGKVYVRNSSNLNREMVSVLTVHVYAQEYLTTELNRSEKSTLRITLLDVNDNSPVYVPHEVIYVSVTAPITQNTTMAWLVATDADLGMNGHVMYSVLYASPPHVDWFDVDGTTGRVFAGQDILACEDVTVVLVAEARDQASSQSRATTCVVEIAIGSIAASTQPQTTAGPTATEKYTPPDDKTSSMDVFTGSTSGYNHPRTDVTKTDDENIAASTSNNASQHYTWLDDVTESEPTKKHDVTDKIFTGITKRGSTDPTLNDVTYIANTENGVNTKATPSDEITRSSTTSSTDKFNKHTSIGHNGTDVTRTDHFTDAETPVTKHNTDHTGSRHSTTGTNDTFTTSSIQLSGATNPQTNNTSPGDVTSKTDGPSDVTSTTTGHDHSVDTDPVRTTTAITQVPDPGADCRNNNKTSVEIALIVSVSMLCALVVALIVGLIMVKQRLNIIRCQDRLGLESQEKYIDVSDDMYSDANVTSSVHDTC